MVEDPAALVSASSNLLLAIFSSSSFCLAIRARLVKLGSVGAFFMALGSDGVLGDGVEDDEDGSDVEIVDGGGGGGDGATGGGGGASCMGRELGRTFVGGGSAGSGCGDL